jgi:2-polyprenyl-3-methyl-5-hydroxy-6-metoxy-1,4-benzoquinol methylase
MFGEDWMTIVVGDREETLRLYNGNRGTLHPSKQRFYAGLRNYRILDVGCGAGTAARFLRECGNTVFGITASPEEAAIGKEVMADVVVADLDALTQLPFERERFDIVILGDVLEHLKYPHSLLKTVKAALKPEGRIYVSIPNVANIKVRIGLLFGNFQYEDAGILDKTHLRFFTLVTAREMLVQAGYAIEQEFYSNWSWTLLPDIFMHHVRLRRVEQFMRDLLTPLVPGLCATQLMFVARPTR